MFLFCFLINCEDRKKKHSFLKTFLNLFQEIQGDWSSPLVRISLWNLKNLVKLSEFLQFTLSIGNISIFCLKLAVAFQKAKTKMSSQRKQKLKYIKFKILHVYSEVHLPFCFLSKLISKRCFLRKHLFTQISHIQNKCFFLSTFNILR